MQVSNSSAVAVACDSQFVHVLESQSLLLMPVSFSAVRCILWLNDASYRKKSEEVNQEVPSWNTMVQLSTPTLTLSATVHNVIDRRQ